MNNEIEPQLRIAVFKGKQIRKIIHNDEWFFSIIDIVEVLTESSNPRRYWSDLKRKLIENEGFAQLYDNIVQLKLIANDGEQRGVKEQREYAILTAEISEATFGLKPSEHKKLKNLKRENLRDHMTDLELIFTMLGEASTTEIAIQQDSQGFHENKEAARAGGSVAGNARKELETKSSRKVVSSSNFLSHQLDVKEE